MTKIQKVVFDPSSKIWDCLILLSTCLLPCAELHPIMDTIIIGAESIRSSGEPGGGRESWRGAGGSQVSSGQAETFGERSKVAGESEIERTV